MWTLRDALTACVFAEQAASACHWHVGLTGGCLYKDGYRKDLDLVFYPHTHQPGKPNELLQNLEAIGFEIGEIFSSVVKAKFQGKPVDLFITERMDLWDEEIPNALGGRSFGRPKGGGGY